MDCVCGHPSLCRRPDKLLGNVSKLRCVQVGVHSSCLEAHGGNREIFINDMRIRMITKHEIHCSVNFLLDTAAQALAAGTAGGRKLLRRHALLFQASPKLCLPSAFFPISSVANAELTMHGAVLLPSAGSEKVRYAYIYANCWG